MKCSVIHVSVKELFLVADVPAPCNRALGSLSCDSLAAAVQQDDTFTISVRTPATTWVALGVSDDQMMVSAEMQCVVHFHTTRSLLIHLAWFPH